MVDLTVEQLQQGVGGELGVSDWIVVTQEDVNGFADATGDHNWLHVDPERARETAFGGTIAHGFFTLSLASQLVPEVLRVDGSVYGLNYGLDRVRFVAPLHVGDHVRVRVALAALDVEDDFVTSTLELTFEARSSGEPVCVATWIVRDYLAERAGGGTRAGGSTTQP
jgi:acyl dehydratase